MEKQVSIKILSQEEMAKLNVYASITTNFKYLNVDGFGSWFNDTKYMFICLFVDTELIGYVKLKTGGNESIRYEGYFNWLMSIEITKEYHKKGLSKLLCLELFKYLKQQNLDHILISGYTEQGIRLRKYLLQLSETFGIRMKDENKVVF